MKLLQFLALALCFNFSFAQAEQNYTLGGGYAFYGYDAIYKPDDKPISAFIDGIQLSGAYTLNEYFDINTGVFLGFISATTSVDERSTSFVGTELIVTKNFYETKTQSAIVLTSDIAYHPLGATRFRPELAAGLGVGYFSHETSLNGKAIDKDTVDLADTYLSIGFEFNITDQLEMDFVYKNYLAEDTTLNVALTLGYQY